MSSQNLWMINREDVTRTLKGLEPEIIQTIKTAYCLHDQGATSLPPSTFLRFPDHLANRIIALPAYVGGSQPVAGLKWIASFPDNLARGLPRASALVILNSTETGFPTAVIEGSMISAYRTAASAALVIGYLAPQYSSIGIVGSGVIGFEVLRFIARRDPDLNPLVKVFDLDLNRADRFIDRCQTLLGPMELEQSPTLAELSDCEILVFTTTSKEPHVGPDFRFRPGSTVLNISLRDISPELILRHRNIVDDIDHVNREETSVHIAAKMAGNLDFVTGTIADLVLGRIQPRNRIEDVVIVSPFGLGILDVALGQLVLERAIKIGLAKPIDDFT